MSRYLKYTIEQKIRACEDYLSGALSVSEICVRLGMSPKNAFKRPRSSPRRPSAH